MSASYYELLRIAPGASKLDIINAYRRAKLTFRKDSLAVYSLYSEDELAAIRRQVDAAYSVLSDREKRQAYDDEHGYASIAADMTEDFKLTDVDNDELMQAGDNQSAPPVLDTASLNTGNKGGDNVVPLHRPAPRDYDPELERQIQSATSFTGSLLREIREYRGISLEEIAGQTNISLTYLRAIEGQDAACLPARAYLKGYLGQYAAEIGLEPHHVVQAYPPLEEE
ncbi:MAG: helix-turn-helix domain-containing protein [Mariprofundaceae bacterium]|nr:helix-turn-helix domain-containing protein [Mariprofundaceae bacterium]